MKTRTIKTDKVYRLGPCEGKIHNFYTVNLATGLKYHARQITMGERINNLSSQFGIKQETDELRALGPFIDFMQGFEASDFLNCLTTM